MPLSRRESFALLASASVVEMPRSTASAQVAASRTQTPTAEMVDTRIGALEFELGVPTPNTVAKLYDEMDFQRAVLCYLWATPIVGMEGVRQALADNAGARSGDLALLEGYRDISVMLGSNITTPYLFAVLDLASDGPLVIEYPAGATAGSLIDWWDRPIVDIGLPGLDKGQGAIFIVAGPGQEVPVDGAPAGALLLNSRTLTAALFSRVLEADPQKAQALLATARIYPYSRRADPPKTHLLKFKREGDLTSMAHPRGLAYWERLANALRGEPVEDRDRFFAAMLKPFGIEKGQPFSPDQRQKRLLTEAAVVGEAMAKASVVNKRFPGMRYRSDAHWEYLIPPSIVFQQDVPNSTQFDERTSFFYEVMGASDAVMSKTPGVGSAYLSAYHDKDGRALDGGRPYRLHVPPNPPAKLFWSVTLYDVDSRCLIQNEEQIADRSSHHDLVKNADGSVDIFLGSTAPTGLEKNWIPTIPGRAWFAYFRLFGPLESYFNRSWPMPDIEPVVL
jgi:hypothetical protein